MNNRTKFLMAAASLVVFGLLGDQGYRRYVEEPAKKRERDAGRLSKKIKAAEDVIFNSVKAADQLLALEQYSLPFDEELARARYQDWLLALVKKAGLQQPSVDAGKPVGVSIKDRGTRKSKEIFKRYSFSMRGRGTLAQATQLLYDFYQGGHLHKIKTLALNPVSGGKQLNITLSIEAIGLTRCQRKGELSTAVANRLAADNLQAYQTIVRRNLFSGENAGTLRDVKLTAITFDRKGNPEAWFSLGDGRRSQVIHRGESLNLPAHQIQVLDIQPRLVLADVNGEVLRLLLGKTIGETLSPPAPAGKTAVR